MIKVETSIKRISLSYEKTSILRMKRLNSVAEEHTAHTHTPLPPGNTWAPQHVWN